jgi:hypothetical protein
MRSALLWHITQRRMIFRYHGLETERLFRNVGNSQSVLRKITKERKSHVLNVFSSFIYEGQSSKLSWKGQSPRHLPSARYYRI